MSKTFQSRPDNILKSTHPDDFNVQQSLKSTKVVQSHLQIGNLAVSCLLALPSQPSCKTVVVEILVFT
jgi:hypothetical protein